MKKLPWRVEFCYPWKVANSKPCIMESIFLLSIPWIWQIPCAKVSLIHPQSMLGPWSPKNAPVEVARVRAALAQATHEFFRPVWAGDEELWKLQGSTTFIETVAGPMAFFMSAAKLLCDVLHEMYNFSLKNSQGHWKLLLEFLVTSLPFRCIRRWSLQQIVKVLARCILAAASLILMVDSRNLPITNDFWLLFFIFLEFISIFFRL